MNSSAKMRRYLGGRNRFACDFDNFQRKPADDVGLALHVAFCPAAFVALFDDKTIAALKRQLFVARADKIAPLRMIKLNIKSKRR